MKKFILSVAVMSAMTLGGCSFGTSIDSLMAPPKLSVEQEQIYNTLKDATGQNIRLKYPKSGNYLSSFIIEDIDSDDENEAVVFYEKTGFTSDESTLRINVLDKVDGKWRSVCDTSAEGSEIEKVAISKLGTNERINIIVGTSILNRSEKNVTIYDYDIDNATIEINFSHSYNYMDILDLDNDETKELFILSSSSDSVSEAAAYKLSSDGKYHIYSTKLSENYTEFENVVYGNIDNERKGIYIDAVSGTGTIGTDILTFSSQGLKSVFEGEENTPSTSRSSGYNTTDIDGDGIYEIPVQSHFPGYSSDDDNQQITMTNWLYLNDNKLIRKCSGYYSISDGYAFAMPEKWLGKVTVRLDTLNDEIVFYKYTNNSEKSSDSADLLRIYIAEDTASKEDRISAGYQLMYSKGEAFYLASVTDDEELGISTGELVLCFKYIK